MLKLKNIHARFEDTEILHGVDLEVLPGEVHVLLGPNGSGKSTLGHVILGDPKYKQTQGEIYFEGQNFVELSPSERAQAGYFLTFQSPPSLDGVSVKEFLFAAKKSHTPEFASSFKFKKELTQSLESLRLPGEFIDRETNLGFSGGERKKIEVASLLTLQPKLAFLDEIDSGIDIDTIREIGKVICKFLEDSAKAIILVTHSEKLLKEINPTHVHIFGKGVIAESGGAELVEKIQAEGFDQYFAQPNSKLNVIN